jgi:hypothetical protein
MSAAEGALIADRARRKARFALAENLVGLTPPSLPPHIQHVFFQSLL